MKATLLFAILMLAIAFHPQSAEASKLKLFRSRQERVFSSSDASEVITNKKSRNCHETTCLLDMARAFDQALIEVNQNKDEIHVGHLLEACERLEKTIRRMGFASSANDIANNMAKIRSTYDDLPSNGSDRDSMPVVLQYEKNLGMHSRGKRDHPTKIKESSATMGFLWLGRSINYQHDMFRYMLEHEEASPFDAASHAYAATVKPHLSWPLQRLGQAALRGIRSVPKNSILAKMGGVPEDQYSRDVDSATKKDLKQVIESWNPIIRRWNQVFLDMGMEGL